MFVRLASRKGSKKRGDILNRQLMFALNCDQVRNPVDAKGPKLLAKCAVAPDVEAVIVASALPAKHRATREFAVTRNVAKVDEESFYPVGIILTDVKLYLPA